MLLQCSDLFVNGVRLSQLISKTENETVQLEAKIREQQKEIDDLKRRAAQIDRYLEDCSVKRHPASRSEHRRLMAFARAHAWHHSS